MLNNLHQLLSPRQWGISLAGLGLLLGLGCIAKQTQVVSVKDSPLSSAQIQKSSSSARLRFRKAPKILFCRSLEKFESREIN